MVNKDNLIDVFVRSVPGFKEIFELYLNDWKNESPGVYSELSELARFIVDLYKRNQLENIKYFFNIVEDVLIHGDEYVQEAIVVGLLEDLQNNLLSNNYELNVFDEYLKSMTKDNWQKVIDFWEGKRHLI